MLRAPVVGKQIIPIVCYWAALSPKELDLVFALFDADGSGTISFGEFEQLARARRSFHVRSRIEEKGDGREFFLPRLLKCTSDAVLSE